MNNATNFATAALLAALCAGCASTATPSAQIAWVEPTHTPSPPGSAAAGAIVVVRDSGATAMQGCNHRILINGRAIADLMPGQGVRVAAAAGSHVVHLGSTRVLCNVSESAVSVSVNPGAPTYLRTMTDVGGYSVIVPSIAPQ